MEKQKYWPVRIVHILLILAIFVCDFMVITMPGRGALENIDLVVAMVALLPGLAYAIHGYQKSRAGHYRSFMIGFAVSEICDVVTLALCDTVLQLSAAACLYTAVACLVLAFAKDLGRSRSLCFVAGSLVLHVATAVVEGIVTGGFAAAVTCAQRILLALIALVFVIGKYLDKSARGTT